MSELARALFWIAAVFAALGVVVLVAGKVPWLGRLPGDLEIRWKGGVFYFPIVTCLVASFVLSILLSIFLRR